MLEYLNNSEIHSFLGLAGYYRRFIEGFSKLAKPLTALFEKSAKSIRLDECQANFGELKKDCATLLSPLVFFFSFNGGS